MSMDRLYTAEATAYGARTGAVVTSDERLDLQLSRPAGMGGDDGPGTNPEQLFAAGYAACFHSALRTIARREKADLGESTITAQVGIGPNENRGFSLTVKLVVDLPDFERAEAERLVEAAHQVCPYSNATRGNIDVVLEVA
jgi:lipoyl-dependent peroxiredoxin